MKKTILILSVFLLSINALLAQVPPPPDNHENLTPGSSDGLPVDQYFFVLIGLALSIGIYFIYNRKKVLN